MDRLKQAQHFIDGFKTTSIISLILMIFVTPIALILFIISMAYYGICWLAKYVLIERGR